MNADTKVTTMKGDTSETNRTIFTGSGHSNVVHLTAQLLRHFENEEVKVWKAVILPNAPLSLHRHDHPRVIVALTGGVMNVIEQNGPTEREVWQTGKAYWLPASPPGTMHADVNVGDKPIEVMVVELEKEK
jgi:quercetin dioxygenase-like cupin family protein